MTVNPSSVKSSSWRSSTGICVCAPTLVVFPVFVSFCALLMCLLYLYIILYLLDDDGGQTVKLRMATRGELFYLLSTSDFLSLISHVCLCVWLLFFCGFLIYSFLWKQYRPPPLHPARALPPSSNPPSSRTSSGQSSFFSPASRSSRNLHWTHFSWNRSAQCGWNPAGTYWRFCSSGASESAQAGLPLQPDSPTVTTALT